VCLSSAVGFVEKGRGAWSGDDDGGEVEVGVAP
jgi:hypothetical protein